MRPASGAAGEEQFDAVDTKRWHSAPGCGGCAQHPDCCASLALFGTAGPAAAQRGAAQPTPVQALVDRITIPYERFTLPNGLTVIVHTDRKAPVVAVSVWYNIGSKDEPVGSTGFAHLFEHLMFNGSENAPNDWFTYTQQIGATDENGTTNTDRTNYFETVPTGALDRALFLESDRMGHLLGGLDQAKLDTQRGVVQNEKRQGDNQPFGLLRYYIFENLTPPGHPYHHSTIGSMGDLNAASLTTVQNWFRANYGPNNAVSCSPAISMCRRRGAWSPLVRADPARPCGGRTSDRRADAARSAGARSHRPDRDDAHLQDVDDPGHVRPRRGPARSCGQHPWRPVVEPARQCAGARRATRGQRLGQRAVVPGSGRLRHLGRCQTGVDPALVGRRLDEITAQFLREGPTADEVQRAVMSGLSGEIGGLESVGGFGGKAVALAQGQLFTGNPEAYRDQIRQFAATTPAQVRDVATHWLSRRYFR